MRVIGGAARRRVLHAPDVPGLRPTIDRVKEAVFSSLQFELEGRTVLDLFSGSGQLGIEALSRGAARADFVDNSRESLECTRKNISACGFEKVSRTYLCDAESYIKSCSRRYDIIFIDPPFRSGIIPKVLEAAAEKTEDSGVIYCESYRDEKLPEKAGNFQICKQSRYGTILVTYYRSRDHLESGEEGREDVL